MSEDLLPPGWARVEIKDLISADGVFVDGDWVESKDQDPSGDVRLIQLADIGEGAFLDKSARFLTSAKADELGCTFLKNRDVLVARMPDPLGRACIFPLEGNNRFVTVVDVCIIRTSAEIASPEFLTAAINFLGTRKQIENLQTGTTRKRISRGNLANVTIPLPPLPEQKRIVAKIEELFSELDAGEASLRLARRQLGVYRQSLLKQAFEGKLTERWRAENPDKLESAAALLARIQSARQSRYEQQLENWALAVENWKKGGEVSERPSKPREPEHPDSPSTEHKLRIWRLPPEWSWTQLGAISFVTKLAGFEYTDYVHYDPDGDLNVIKAENAGPNGFRSTDYSRVKSETIACLTRSVLNGGELLVVFVGAGTGNVAIVPSDERFFLGPNIAMARPDSPLTSTRFLELFLRSPMGRDLLLASSKAVAQPSLSMGTIRQVPLPLCSLAEQQEIVRLLDEQFEVIEQNEREIDAALQRSEALRQSILKKAFTGQLVPQDPTDEPAAALLQRIRAAQSPLKTRLPRPAAII